MIRTRASSQQKERKEVFLSEQSITPPKTGSNQGKRKRASQSVEPSKKLFLTSLFEEESGQTQNNFQQTKQSFNSASSNKVKKNQRQKLIRSPFIDRGEEQNQDRSDLRLELYQQKLNFHFQEDEKDPKWSELKIVGSNIQSRSRSSMCIHEGHLYIYGGYEIKAGYLSDFWKINLGSEQYQWEKVNYRGMTYPGPKCRHTCTIYENKLYLFGGQHSTLQSSSDMWCYDFQREYWSLIIPKNKAPPSVYSHSSVLIRGKFYVIFGYFSERGTLSNAVYEYEFSNSSWKCLFHNTLHNQDERKNNSFPKGRFESAVAYLQTMPNAIFLFGGNDGFSQTNDLWIFNIEQRKYEEVLFKGTQIPMIRSGHQLFPMGNKLVLLGGFHEVTWEIDDLSIFDPQEKSWVIIDQDSTRRKGIQKIAIPPISPERKTYQSAQNDFPKLNNVRSYSQKRSNSNVSSPLKRPKGEIFEDPSQLIFSQRGNSPTILEEQKRKEFLARKMQMLSTFQVSNRETEKYRELSPTSEAMKNSLLRNPLPSLKIRTGRLLDFGRVTFSRFLQPLKVQMKIRKGKKPCARDGHRVICYGQNKVLLFGGDRHNMSFNDIYQLDLDLLLSKYQDMKNQYPVSV